MGFLYFSLGALIAACILYGVLFFVFRGDIYTIDSINRSPAILVLGAGLEHDNTPSDILKDRLLSTVDLINTTSPNQVILSGAQVQGKESEPQAMADFLFGNNITEKIIFQDNFGRSTFHSMINLRSHDIKQPVTIISQRFHLTRALLIAKMLGIDGIGLAATNLSFSPQKIIFWYFREIVATPFNFGKIILHPILRFLGKS